MEVARFDVALHNLITVLMLCAFMSVYFLSCFAGYVTRGCTQPAAVDITLKVLVSAAPIALIIIGLLIFISYPINEERRQGNRKLLNEQRELECEADSSETELVNVL